MSFSEMNGLKWAKEAIKYIFTKTSQCTSPLPFTPLCKRFTEEHQEYKNRPATLRYHVIEMLKKIEGIEDLDILQKVQILFVLSQPVSLPFQNILDYEEHEIRLDGFRRITYFRSKDGTFERLLTDDHDGRTRNRAPIGTSTQSTRGEPRTVDDRETNEQGTSASGDPNFEDHFGGRRQSPPLSKRDERPHIQVKPVVFHDPPRQGDGRNNVMDGQPPQDEMFRQEEGDGSEYDYEYDPDIKREVDGEQHSLDKADYQVRLNEPIVYYGVEEEVAIGGPSRPVPAETRVQSRRQTILVPIARKTVPQRESTPNAQQQQQVEQPSTSNSKRRQGSVPTEAKRLKPSTEGGTSSSASASERDVGSSTTRKAAPRQFDLRKIYVSTSQGQASRSNSTAATPRSSQEPSTPTARVDADSSTVSVNSTTTSASSRPTSEEKSIGVGIFCNQLEDTAVFCNLPDLERRAIEVGKMVQNRNRTINLDSFHVNIAGILMLAKKAKVAHHEGKSMLLKLFFKRLRNTLTRPLGEELVADTLDLIDDEIKELEDRGDESVLPMDKVRSFLDTILRLASST